MLVTCNVALDEGQTLSLAPDEAAQKVLTALGLDETADHVTVLVQQHYPGTDRGDAGTELTPGE